MYLGTSDGRREGVEVLNVVYDKESADKFGKE